MERARLLFFHTRINRGGLVPLFPNDLPDRRALVPAQINLNPWYHKYCTSRDGLLISVGFGVRMPQTSSHSQKGDYLPEYRQALHIVVEWSYLTYAVGFGCWLCVEQPCHVGGSCTSSAPKAKQPCAGKVRPHCDAETPIRPGPQSAPHPVSAAVISGSSISRISTRTALSA